MPNPVNTPMLTEKGETKLTIGYTNGLQGQFASAITDEIGVMANGGFGSDEKSNSGLSKSNRKITSNFFEGGIGYFSRLSGSLIFEFYGGAGYGHFNDEEKNNSSSSSFGSVKGNIARFFIQPSFGLALNGLSLSLALRNSYVNLLNYTAVKDNVTLGKGGIFFEPALTMKIGGKKFKFIMQLALSLPFDGAEVNGWDVQFATGIIGLEFNLGEIFK
jgi:hypothetical protein